MWLVLGRLWLAVRRQAGGVLWRHRRSAGREVVGSRGRAWKRGGEVLVLPLLLLVLVVVMVIVVVPG